MPVADHHKALGTVAQPFLTNVINSGFCEENVIFHESHVYPKKFIILANKGGWHGTSGGWADVWNCENLCLIHFDFNWDSQTSSASHHSYMMHIVKIGKTFFTYSPAQANTHIYCLQSHCIFGRLLDQILKLDSKYLFNISFYYLPHLVEFVR